VLKLRAELPTILYRTFRLLVRCLENIKTHKSALQQNFDSDIKQEDGAAESIRAKSEDAA
jgi:hypothetical protein